MAIPMSSYYWVCDADSTVHDELNLIAVVHKDPAIEYSQFSLFHNEQEGINRVTLFIRFREPLTWPSVQETEVYAALNHDCSYWANPTASEIACHEMVRTRTTFCHPPMFLPNGDFYVDGGGIPITTDEVLPEDDCDLQFELEPCDDSSNEPVPVHACPSVNLSHILTPPCDQ